uniref:Uncharacterized protein n=1 Tax=Oryza nivara TaxID=4536 RepID=A0A0E0IUI7_ORYNI
MDVMMQLLLGLALCMWAGLAVPAKFLSVLPHSKENRLMETLQMNVNVLDNRHITVLLVLPPNNEEQMDFVILKVEKRDMMISQRKKA